MWLLLLLAAGAAAIFFMRSRKQFFTTSGVVWTTDYHITYEAARNLDDSVQRIFADVDASVSAFNPQSRVSAINRNESNTADAYFIRLYRKAQQVHAASDSLYDPTVMPLVNAWGFGYKSGQLPTAAQLDSILAFVGLHKTRLDGATVVKDDPRTQFDFSSIAKGMAVDEVAAMLRRNGATNFLVEIGGEVTARGVNSRGETWRVSADLPVDERDGNVQHHSAAVLLLRDRAVATSGNYRKFRESGGKKLSHIVNPLTGDAGTSSLLSVTVVAPDCMSADAWATACMAMGEERTRRRMERNDTLGVMTISAGANGALVVWSNRAFARVLEVGQ